MCTLLPLRGNFGGRNFKMGPLAGVVGLATSLGLLSWPYWLGAFMVIDVVLGGGGGVGLAICQAREMITP